MKCYYHNVGCNFVAMFIISTRRLVIGPLFLNVVFVNCYKWIRL